MKGKGEMEGKAPMRKPCLCQDLGQRATVSQGQGEGGVARPGDEGRGQEGSERVQEPPGGRGWSSTLVSVGRRASDGGTAHAGWRGHRGGWGGKDWEQGGSWVGGHTVV